MAEVDTNSEVIESKVNESENEDESKENEDGGKSLNNTPKPKRTPLKTLPLYDSPLTQSGKRVRTPAQQYVVEKKEEFVYEFNGTGVALGEIEYIEFMINKQIADNLKKLHSVCFNRPGDKNNVKKNLRQFKGFDFDKTDKKYEEKKSKMDRLTKAELGNICKILGLEVSGSKPDVVVRVLDFVLKPVDNNKSIPKKKKKSKSGKKKRSDTGKKKGPRKSKGGDTESDSAVNDENDSTANDDSTADDTADSSDSGSESETEEKPKKTPAKKPAKTPAKKVSTKTPAKKTPAKKTPAKKTPAKKSPAKRSKSEVDSDSDSSDDEPLIKKTKSPPTNDEIKQKVEKLLKDADLEEISMKSVCKQIYEMYPGFDLTDRKSFIKETVKTIIS